MHTMTEDSETLVAAADRISEATCLGPVAATALAEILRAKAQHIEDEGICGLTSGEQEQIESYLLLARHVLRP